LGGAFFGQGAGALASVTRTPCPRIPQVFDATREECPDNIRIFVEAVGLLMNKTIRSTQGEILGATPASQLAEHELVARERAKAEREAKETARAAAETKRVTETEAAEAEPGTQAQAPAEADALEAKQEQLHRAKTVAADIALDIAEVVLIGGQCIPVIGQACTAAKDFLQFVRDKDLPDDVTEATHEVTDILESLKVSRTGAVRHVFSLIV
jgi:hypothetical protein